jgi:hypothetical protein
MTHTIDLRPGYASLDLAYEGSDGLTHYAKLVWVYGDGTARISRGYYGSDRVETLDGFRVMRTGELLRLPERLYHDPSGRECALAGRGEPDACKACLLDIEAEATRH